MTKLKQKITNPMTIIAIFATLSETSAAISLPFLGNEERQTYIWFLISFPFYLLLLFFVTLNLNHRSLYAPSDFEKGKHFFRSMNNEREKQGSADSGAEQQRLARPATRERVPAHCVARSSVRLPASFNDLLIIDARGKNRKIDYRDVFAKHQEHESDEAQVVVFLTNRNAEKQLKSCAPKLNGNRKKPCHSVFCVAYNVCSQEITVMDEVCSPAPAELEPQEGHGRKPSETV